MTKTDTMIPERPSKEQIEKFPSCRIMAAIHELELARHASDSTLATIQLRQAVKMAWRGMLAQVDAESADGRRSDLPDDQE